MATDRTEARQRGQLPKKTTQNTLTLRLSIALLIALLLPT